MKIYILKHDNVCLQELFHFYRKCKKWGVVTTIYGPTPSEAIRRFLYRRNQWCVVVVGDKQKPDVVQQITYFSSCMLKYY